MAGRRSFTEFRLPPGRHGLPPEQVAENQRWRLLGAAAEVVAARGFLDAKAPEIARCAGVSRATFYRHFEDLSACLAAAYGVAAECAVDVISASCDSEEEWGARLRAAVEATLEFLAAEPALAALFGSEVAAGVPQVAAGRSHLIERLAPLLAAGRGDGSAELPSGAEFFMIAGALSIVSDRIASREVESLPDLAPALVEVLAAPYQANVAK